VLLILAPSKTQQFNKREYSEHTIPALIDKAQYLADRICLLSRDQLSQLMKTSEKLTSATHDKFHSFHTPFTLENADQALFTFQGDSYKAITAEKYSNKDLVHAQQHLRILSGLYGILRPLDLMQPYRLEMGSRFTTEDFTTLYQFWGSLITDIINKTLGALADKTLVNLASTEYAKVINRKELAGRWIDITFRQRQKGQYKTIPIHSKRARGLMVDFMITNRIDRAEDLLSFALDGYLYNKEISTTENWYFCKG
jgi:cytoplasmic iron level regulating protein YaaA (DUF328/UPF0246 family)